MAAAASCKEFTCRVTNHKVVISVGYSAITTERILVPNPDAPNARLSDFFLASLEEYGDARKPSADVSIKRGAELIRADRDGRSPAS